MSDLPIILSLANDLNRVSMAPFYREPSSSSLYRCPYFALFPEKKLGRNDVGLELGPVSTIGKDGFQVCMDVQQFKPSELSVKVIDNCILIEGKHEEREDDHGYISRHFVRRYIVPKDYQADKVASSLSSDGVLTIHVPNPATIKDKANERVVQIQQVGPAHLNVKENRIEEAKIA